MQKIQGRWLDHRESEAVIEVIGKRMLWVFQEDVMAERRIEVFDHYPKICVGKSTAKGEGFFVAYDSTGGYCYQILRLQDNVFDYVPVGAVKD
ncbi:MAG: hypothetical protein HKN16_01535 [Saprospiraceae bacterium]|nr:hypothetical protein [Saprospiraceae bacterium]